MRKWMSDRVSHCSPGGAVLGTQVQAVDELGTSAAIDQHRDQDDEEGARQHHLALAVCRTAHSLWALLALLHLHTCGQSTAVLEATARCLTWQVLHRLQRQCKSNGAPKAAPPHHCLHAVGHPLTSALRPYCICYYAKAVASGPVDSAPDESQALSFLVALAG